MKKQILSHAAKVTLNVLFYVFIITLLVFSAANIRVKKENDIANVFGTGFLSVQSNSMAGADQSSFNKGDLIFVKMLSENQTASLQIGQVVTYFDHSIKAFNTHRIVDRFSVDGEIYFTTQGDNVSEPDAQPLHHSQVLAAYRSNITGLGTTLDYLQSPSGFAVMIILPVVIILIIEGIILVRNIMHSSKVKFEKEFKVIEQKAMSELEVEKEKIRKQILAELKIGQESKSI
jgi:signal peptidase I